MTLQQLEYILALDRHRHFARAAEACFVTQATLSTMVQKLEAELGVLLFDRSRQPVVPTPLGERVLAQAREVQRQAARLRELVAEEKDALAGEVRLGVIPTLAPYLLPLFLRDFTAKYPQVTLHIAEHTTEQLVQRLKAGQLDVGLAAIPLQENGLREVPLFYEPYVLYLNAEEARQIDVPTHPQDLDLERLWLLEEGHCMRDQIAELCELSRRRQAAGRLHYQAGSIETLRNLVDHHDGYTIIPELAARAVPVERQGQIRPFAAPVPVREIGLVCAQGYPKERVLKALRDVILANLPEGLEKKEGKVLGVRR